ncbi:nuclear transport factor 2 family protein [Streptomyces sp. WZ-12]|uniref:nuclear transport factor 2 family protein n=1 Tax=Streptomyces sp. WZ-12 TaxID=3030210 RepID=UPI0023810169|nr:nuclear transport factor 2 family protein [Streptomyces sp. WZ-12]
MTTHQTTAARRPDDRRLQLLLDRAEITDLLARLQHSLDEGVFDEAWGRAYYAEDATAEMPIGTVRGRDAVVTRIREGMALFARTMHLGGAAVIEVDGDRATARAPQLSTHVLADGSGALFVSGGHAATELVRTPDGWRITASTLRIAWTQGTPPRLPTGTGPAADAA